MDPGQAFEKELFGVTDESEEPFSLPPVLDFEESIQEVIQSNWANFGLAQETGASYVHNPLKPEMGRTGELWLSVKDNLPNNINGHEDVLLNLYVAVGWRNSLDCHYGTDALFWWEGVYVRLDASLAYKRRNLDFSFTQQRGERRRKKFLKADFQISPWSLTQGGMSLIGSGIANVLINRRRALLEEPSKIAKIRWV